MIKYLVWVFALCLLASCSKKFAKIYIEQPSMQQVAPDTIDFAAEPSSKPDISPPQIAVFDRVIQFDFDRSVVRPDMLPIMRESARIMRDNPAIMIRATGHTCDIGTVQYNHSLGLRRAVAVRDYLIANGIDGKRIEIESMGESEPVGTREQNRRCEINTLWK